MVVNTTPWGRTVSSANPSTTETRPRTYKIPKFAEVQFKNLLNNVCNQLNFQSAIVIQEAPWKEVAATQLQIQSMV